MFSIKYILMSLVINTLLGYVYSLLNKNISFKLEMVNNEIKKKSFFYDNVLLGNSYYLMYSANNN